VTEHLSIKGMPYPREGHRCFWCPNKTSTPPLGAFDALRTIENGLKMRKLQSPS